MKNEWARTADDILWRRSKLGLRFSEGEVAALTRYMEDALKRQDIARGD
jgi:glycerol-3-phosphate dehydrogenase